MTLTLRIENFDTLEDGGPLWLSLDQRGASIGRRRGMDWVLPDPAKHISGHHFDIAYADGAYWLTDVSTNGTFVEGTRHRLDGPHRLSSGERLMVGHYVIAVHIAQPVAAVAPPPPPRAAPAAPQAWDVHAPHAPEEPDPWDFGGGPTPAINPMPPQPAAHPTGPAPVEFDFMPLQQPGQTTGLGAGIQQPGVPQHGNPVTTPPFFGGQPPAAPPALQMPGVALPPATAPRMPPAAPAPQPVLTETPAPPPPPPPMHAPAMASGQGDAAFVAAFCAGAGINPGAAQAVPAEALAYLLGQVVRGATEEIMRMLQDRSNVKHFTKGGERTMRSATGNNPMKFLPDAEQAIEAMFLRPRDGFMTGPDGYRNALKDLSAHQSAVFAALQPALAAVLEGISPEDIEAAETTGNLLGGSRKSKSWDLFVKRWDAKADQGEHGMLDAFLQAFARAYAQANARSD